MKRPNRSECVMVSQMQGRLRKPYLSGLLVFKELIGRLNMEDSEYSTMGG